MFDGIVDRERSGGNIFCLITHQRQHLPQFQRITYKNTAMSIIALSRSLSDHPLFGFLGTRVSCLIFIKNLKHNVISCLAVWGARRPEDQR